MSDGGSLLNFLDAPVVVGDPEGRVILVNPAFERSFVEDGRSVEGLGFAELFAGGGREAFLSAVAQVCQTGETVRFQLREDGRGYVGVASPIVAQDDRVGVLIHLADEPFSLQRLLTIQRELHEPLEEVQQCLEELLEQTGGRRAERFRAALEVAIGATERARKWSADLRSLLTGQAAPGSAQLRLDPVRTLRIVQSRVESECERAGVRLEILAPSTLPSAVGDGRHLETVLVRMLRDRLMQCDRGMGLALGVRKVSIAERDCIVFSLVAPPRPDARRAHPNRLRDSIATLGGFEHVCIDSSAGRVTSIAMPTSEASGS